jgi:hypothetical protein
LDRKAVHSIAMEKRERIYTQQQAILSYVDKTKATAHLREKGKYHSATDGANRNRTIFDFNSTPLYLHLDYSSTLVFSRDIGRCFRRSLPPILTLIATCDHVTCYHSFCHRQKSTVVGHLAWAWHLSAPGEWPNWKGSLIK